MPTVLRHSGFRDFFFSNASDEPPHVHMEKAEGAAKLWLHPDVELAWSIRFRGREVSKIQAVIEGHQEWFLEKWNEYFENKT